MDAERPELKTAPPFSAAAIAALRQRNKIEAIKITREEQNIGLQEAKDAVEEYARGDPMLQTSPPTAQTKVKRGAMLWFAALFGFAFLAYHFLSSREAWQFVLLLAEGLQGLCH